MLDRLYEWVTRTAIRKYLPSLVRHALTLAAGFLIASGLPDAAAQLEGIAGPVTEMTLAIALWAVAQLWSFKDKKPSEPKPVKPAIVE